MTGQIVFLDDETAMRTLAGIIFPRKGFDEVIFHESKKEIDAFLDEWKGRELPCDMVFILDIDLPDGKGSDVAQRIRSEHPEAHILMHSAGNDALVASLISRGVADGAIKKRALQTDESIKMIKDLMC